MSENKEGRKSAVSGINTVEGTLVTKRNKLFREQKRHKAACFSVETRTNKQTNNWMWVVGAVLKTTQGQELNYKIHRDQLTGFTCSQTPPTRALTPCLSILHCSTKGDSSRQARRRSVSRYSAGSFRDRCRLIKCFLTSIHMLQICANVCNRRDFSKINS